MNNDLIHGASKVDYYIDKVVNCEGEKNWKDLFKEVMEWLKTASEEKEAEFAESGAGEILYMTVSAIEDIEADKHNCT